MKTVRGTTLLAAVTALAIGTGLLAVGPAGAAAPPRPKALIVTAAPATSVWSQAVKLTATITPKGGGAPRGGTVTFLADGVPVGSAPATTRNTVVTTTGLPPGEHAVTAAYAGDDRTAPGTSAPTTVVVGPAPTTLALTPVTPRVLAGHRGEVKAVVQAVAPAATTRRPTGRVTFTMACQTASVAVNANGVATWRPRLCPGGPGSRTIRATYTGSERHAASAQASTTVRMVFPTQDQQTTGDPGPDVPVVDSDDEHSAYAQTFTAGRTGLLSDVSFGVSWEASPDGLAPEPLGVSIRAVDQAGRPVGAPLGTGTFSPTAIPEGEPYFRTVALDVMAPITTGTRYALVLEGAHDGPAPQGRWHLWTTPGDTYPDPLHRRDATGVWTPQTHDLLFTTFVYSPT